MGIPGATNPLLLASQGGYQVSKSLRFNSSDSAYLSRTPASAGNRRTWTFSLWVKRGALGSSYYIVDGRSTSSTNPHTWIAFDSSDRITVSSFGASASEYSLVTTQVFRDTSAWYHIIVAVDTTQATAANRVKLYVNGSEVTVFGTANYPTLNLDTHVNAAQAQSIGSVAGGVGDFFSGYLADIHFIDGQALTPSSFTEVSATTGQLIPKTYTGSFGTNGFWLKFSDNSAATATTLGKDYSGNSNNWTPNNLSVTAGAGNDSLTDTPTSYGTDTGAGSEVRGNYCTLNPLNTSSIFTLSNGNLNYLTATAANMGSSIGTIGVSSGKWYWEGTLVSARGSFGVARQGAGITVDPGATSLIYYYRFDGNKYNNGGSAYGATYAANDVIGVALDLDAGTLTFYKNGVSQGTAFSSLPSDTYFPQAGDDMTSFTTEGILNFGQRPFAYTAPSGFKALCDTNLPAPVVAKPNTVMDVKLYTGNGSTQTISGLGFSPDFVWIKCRSAANTHALVDSIRGVTKYLVSASTDAEVTDSGGITSLNSDGFSLTFPTTNAPTINANSATYVAWSWDAGTTTSSNVAGSITSSVRANTSAGFSIVTYVGTGGTGGTVGHGLGVAPSLIIAKSRSASRDWAVYHKDLTKDKYLNLNATTAASTTTSVWGNAEPTSTVFGVYAWSTAQNNANGENMVAYCFAPVAGYSSFGSYVGNGSADGPFIYTGFRPKFILVKNTSVAGAWEIYDSVRNPYNVMALTLLPNASDAEITASNGVRIDFTSNGFKWRDNGSSINGSGNTIIWAAFAESPFQYARAR